MNIEVVAKTADDINRLSYESVTCLLAMLPLMCA